MKHILTCVIILMTCYASGYGQSVMIFMKNGEKAGFNVNEIDSLVFYEHEAPGTSTDSDYEKYMERILQRSLVDMQDDLVKFFTSQLVVEAIPLRLGEGKLWFEFQDYYENAWYNGYKVVKDCMELMNSISSFSTLEKYEKYVVEMRTLKAFAYYNIAQLWHNISLYKEYEDLSSEPRQSTINEALSYIEEELKWCIESADEENPVLFNNDFRYMLLAEVYMYDKNYAAAAEAISKIKDPEMFLGYNLSDYDYWTIDKNYTQLGFDNNIVIYSPEKLALMTKECQNQTEGLVSDWKEIGFGYGYWAALKRLDAAKDEILGDGYNYLMPIPEKVLIANLQLRQNDGYR